MWFCRIMSVPFTHATAVAPWKCDTFYSNFRGLRVYFIISNSCRVSLVLVTLLLMTFFWKILFLWCVWPCAGIWLWTSFGETYFSKMPSVAVFKISPQKVWGRQPQIGLDHFSMRCLCVGKSLWQLWANASWRMSRRVLAGYWKNGLAPKNRFREALGHVVGFFRADSWFLWVLEPSYRGVSTVLDCRTLLEPLQGQDWNILRKIVSVSAPSLFTKCGSLF